MRFIKMSAAACALLVSVSVAADAKPKKNIVEVADDAGVFSTLLAAATAAGFADDLAEVDGLTVLAPTDDAFDKLPPGTVDDLLKPKNKDKLRAIIAYHILPAKVKAKQIGKKPDLVETLNGCERVRTEKSKNGKKVFVDGVKVAAANVKASNGIIHIIPDVLLPERGCP